MSQRHEFSNRTKTDAYERSNGCCEACGISLHNKRKIFDHGTPDWMGGKNTVENCRVLCEWCDKIKTAKDQGDIAKSKRIIRKARGIRKRSRFPGSRDSKYKIKIDGTIILR